MGTRAIGEALKGGVGLDDLHARLLWRVLDMAAADRLLIAGMHVHFPGFAHVVRRGEGFDLIPEAWSPVV